VHYELSDSIKRRIILELREFWAQDPKYRDSLVGNIQGRHSFDERPQQALVVKGASALPIRFSADNFQGTVVSYCSLFKTAAQPGTSVEWVREDVRAIQKNGGVFPSEAGIYYIEVRREEYAWQGVPRQYLVFYVDPLLSVLDESPSKSAVDPRIYTVSAGSFHPGSLAVYEMPGNLPLTDGINFSSDPITGEITLVRPLPTQSSLSVDYRYAGTSTGPFPVEENGANNSAIPGVILAFGRRAQEGDVMAVRVSNLREPSAREYGGRFEVSLDIDVLARDVHAQAEIADRTFMYLQAELRDRLSFEGIEIDQVSNSGEAEESYDENEDSLYYTASLSLTIMTNWSIRLPLGPAFTRIIANTVEAEQIASALDDDQLIDMGSSTGLVMAEQLGLQPLQDPWFRNRSRNYEMIR